MKSEHIHQTLDVDDSMGADSGLLYASFGADVGALGASLGASGHEMFALGDSIGT